jgi:hypothetical protein
MQNVGLSRTSMKNLLSEEDNLSDECSTAVLKCLPRKHAFLFFKQMLQNLEKLHFSFTKMFSNILESTPVKEYKNVSSGKPEVNEGI